MKYAPTPIRDRVLREAQGNFEPDGAYNNLMGAVGYLYDSIDVEGLSFTTQNLVDAHKAIWDKEVPATQARFFLQGLRKQGVVTLDMVLRVPTKDFALMDELWTFFSAIVPPVKESPKNKKKMAKKAAK